jgi:exosortase/archaeosortase family protein
MRLGKVQKQNLLLLLRVLGITSAVALIVYYLPNYFFYEKLTAEHSAVLLQLIGIKGTVWYQGDRVFLNQFEIQRMCTGVQVIAVFLGIIVAIPKVALIKRALAFVTVAVTIYLANLGRIAFEIWLLYNGVLPWSLAHYPTGLFLGVFAVAFLIVVADYFIPQIGDLAFSTFEGFLNR